MTALLGLLGSVALLLWGLRIVQSGVAEALASELQRILQRALHRRWTAFAAGVGVTAALQSSTATALMLGGFATRSALPLSGALATMVGANVGSSLIVHALAFDTGPAASALFILGLIATRRRRVRSRGLGRAAIGLGLVLLALHQLVGFIGAAVLQPGTRDLILALGHAPLNAFVLGAVLAGIAHSSVAIILVGMSLAATQGLDLQASLALVIGANLGSAVNPVIVFRRERAALRLAVGNLVNRLLGCILILPALPMVTLAIGTLGVGMSHSVALFNSAFNFGLALIFLCILPWIAHALERFLPDISPSATPETPRFLDPAALTQPDVALSNATREILRMVETLDEMLRGANEVLRSGDRDRIAEVSGLDDVLDGLHAAIERYLGRMPARLNADEERRRKELLIFAIHLEYAGDVIERSLLPVAASRIERCARLNTADAERVSSLFERLSADLQLATAVLLSGDADGARRLFEAKDRFRDVENEIMDRHFGDLSAGGPGALESSHLLLDTIRDLKRIEAHLVGSAQPVLTANQLLRGTRLVESA